MFLEVYSICEIEESKDEKQGSGPQMNVMSRKSEIHNKLSSKGQRVGENLFSEPHAVHILSSVIYTQT